MGFGISRLGSNSAWWRAEIRTTLATRSTSLFPEEDSNDHLRWDASVGTHHVDLGTTRAIFLI